MTIAFPRELFAVRYLEVTSFGLSYAMAQNRTGAGMIEVMETGDPVWAANYTTEPLSWAQRSQFMAWAASLRGGLQTFLAHDPFRQWPQVYGKGVLSLTRSGGGAFDGTASLNAIGANSVTLSQLPNGYQAALGDMVSLPRPSKQRSLHQFVEAVTGNGAGQLTGNVEPAVPTDAVISSPDVRLVKAPCVMIINWDSVRADAGHGKRSASFQATQTTVPLP